MSAEVVQLREGPLLSDIVGQIRAFADRIEAGEYGEVETVFAILPRAREYPMVLGWGDITNTNDPVIQLELAKHWLLVNLVQRG